MTLSTRFTAPLVLAGVMFCAAAVSPLAAHETDQFTIPIGRKTADLGPHMAAWAYDAIERGVEDANSRIAQALEGGNKEAAARYQTPESIASIVASKFAVAYFVIEGLEADVHSTAFKQRFPGQVVGYKDRFNHSFAQAHLAIDPRQLFRFWFASTIKVDGVYLGNDKVGHFTDMGRTYYEEYAKARAAGKSEAEAEAQMNRIGTDNIVLSESGVLGKFSAGAYSNADLMSNYAGYLFYRNLAEPMMLKGQQRPAMLRLEGGYWQIAPHVSPESGFFSWFMSDHWDEALNPSLYDGSMRSGIRKAIEERADAILWRYSDEHGCRRPPQWFDQKQRELQTYYGKPYGYQGEDQEIITIGEAVYDGFKPDGPLNEYNTAGYLPLHIAVLRGDAALVRKLLDRGAAVDARSRRPAIIMPDSGVTALHLAARDGHAEIARLLIERRADVNARSETGATPLHMAVDAPQIAAMLLARGAKVNSADVGGQTVLHWAAADERGSSMATLLASGAAVNAPDNKGQTPLHIAALRGRTHNAAALVQHGADVNATDKLGATPLHFAAGVDGAASGPEGELMLTLLESGGALLAVDDFGSTPLHHAARFGNRHAVRMLLQRGAHPGTPDMYGNTPLHLAGRRGDAEMVAALIEGGGDANAANAAGKTPLHEAAFSGSGATVNNLLAAGGNPMARDAQGRTPIATADQRGFFRLAVLLRRNEAGAGATNVFASDR